MRSSAKWHAVALVALAALVAACSDGPSGIGSLASAVEASAGAVSQTALKGQPVAVAPAVVVSDADGEPLRGVKVSFVVTQGGGSVASSTATTNASGVASAGTWTLGPAAGVNRVEARVGLLTPVAFTATATDAPPPVTGSFDITVRYLTNPTLRQRQSVDAAVARWRTVIVGDLPNVPMTVPAGACSPAQPALNETVDDVLLLIDFDSIDGAGKVLGQAGPCYVRSSGGLPIVGVMKLDAADLAQLQSIGTLDDVVLHEMGHVLGIGTLWSTAGLLAGAGSSDPQFTGSRAVSAFRGMGGLTVGVPVENTGGTGTRDGHWRESVFLDELMTGWVARGSNPLSGLTIASLQDLGYGASLAAAGTYVFGGSSQSLRSSAGNTVSTGVDLRGREHIHGPRFRVDRQGRKHDIDS